MPRVILGSRPRPRTVFYCLDDDFGPFFLKLCSYVLYNARLCINGHHWPQRQATKAGVGFVLLDNAFDRVDDPQAVQRICDQLGAEPIRALLHKWLAILPNPFTDADHAAGYDYDVSMLHAEFSLTQRLDTPMSGRVFFEQVIRDNLDVGPIGTGRVDLRPQDLPERAAGDAGPVPDSGDHRRRRGGDHARRNVVHLSRNSEKQQHS